VGRAPLGRPLRRTAAMRLRLEHDLACEAHTEAFAGRIAPLARAGDVIALSGDLGAGKTVFARAFVRARLRTLEEVPSPTFTLLQTYESADVTDAPVWHFDLFRLDAAQDAIELGIEDAFLGAISLIEWPDRLGSLLPAGRLDVLLTPGPSPDSRRALVEGDDDWWHRFHEAGLA
jgi:tRNA threonylcarbamoyladenosine biosynthesis protein TsaE